MRVKTHIVLNPSKKARKALLKINKDFTERNYELNIFAIDLYTDTEEYKNLVVEFKKRKVKFNELYKWRVYTDKELEKAKYLELIPAAYWGYPQPEDDYKDTTYDSKTGCSKCGEGKLQKQPFWLRKPSMGNKDIVALHWVYEHIITDKLANLIKKAKLVGYELWPILHHKTKKEIPGFKQLFINNTLPPMAKKTKFDVLKDPKPCKCKKIGYNLTEEIYYHKRDLMKAKDFNKTYEWTGGGYGTTQNRIVSQRVYKLFTENNIKRVRFEPIKIVEG